MDFTKEELQELLYCISHYMNCKWSNPSLLKLLNKLELMIERLHEPDCEHYWEAKPVEIKAEVNPVTYDASAKIVKCKHCGILR